MNHLERLVRRALAVPRDRPQGVFDPFDQSLPWALDTLAAPAPPIEPATVAERLIAPASPTIVRPDMPLAAPVHAPAPTPDSPGTANALPLPAPMSLSIPLRQSEANAAAERAPQARADAFMRALGVAMPQVDAPAVAAPAASAVTAPSAQIARSSTPRAALPGEPPPIRPIARARAEIAPTPPRQRMSAPAPVAARPSPTPPAPPPRAAVAPPTVQIIRTLPAATRSPALDDLAHGSHIVRFGIGQG